ncbi:unnamed protein product [Pocillopora meandrina]|uniref:DDE Tnp4 domain-containing protein n=1 Tax=Pocillopora meandrina TaxID=46732 RepID=A0AAU9WW07_9CNID|nr:unnamed protein product [Pocillopora meandrina]
MNIRCPQRTICDRIEGLCMLLRRFSYPCRYSDMISRFGRPVPELCMITNEGKKHDASMLVDSNLLHELEQNAFSPTGEPMCVFGDPAYPLRVHLQAPFRHGILTPVMEGYNAEMSSVRVTVEWLFGDIINDLNCWTSKRI